jgi:hypothetical protein
MKALQLLKTRQWVIARRLLLLGIILILAYRSYGGAMFGWLQKPNPARDIAITRSEFRADIPGVKPSWIIGFKNSSARFAYDRIQLEATYVDKAGAVVQKDTLVVRHKILPGEETILGSPDFRERPGAVTGYLKIVNADKAN